MAATAIEIKGGYNTHFTGDEVYIKAISEEHDAHGVTSTGSYDPATIIVAANKFNIYADAYSIADGIKTAADITSNELNISVTSRGGQASGVRAENSNVIVDLKSDITRITTASKDSSTWNYSLYAINGAQILLNTNPNGSVYNSNAIVQLTGSIFAHNYSDANIYSNIYVNLTNQDSYVKGLLLENAPGSTYVNFSNGAQWIPTRNDGIYANNAHATFNNAVLDLAQWYGKANSYRNITLSNPTLISSNTLIINSDVQNDTADVLTIGKLSDASSNNILQNIKIGWDPLIDTVIANGIVGDILIEAPNDPILIVNILDNNGKTVTAQAIAGQVEGYLTSYNVIAKLIKRDENNTETNIYIDAIEINEDGNPSEQIQNGDDDINAIKWMGQILNDGVKRHLGGLRVNEKLYPGGIWARVYNVGLNTKTSFEGRNLKQKMWGGQLGYDKKSKSDDVAVFTGAYLDYLSSNNTFARGTGKTESIGGVLYGTWLNEQGQYLDLTAKVAKINGNYSLRSLAEEKIHADYDTWSWALNAEVGTRIKLNTQWVIEPQAQLTYSRINGMKYDLSSGVKMDVSDITSTVGRIGTSFGREFDNGEGTFYAAAFYFHDFSKSSKYRASYLNEQYQGAVTGIKDWYSVSAGANVKFSDKKDDRFYVEAERLIGSKINNNYIITAGIRMSF